MDDLLVEREQHNQKKAQWMKAPLHLFRVQRRFVGGAMDFITLSDAFFDRYSECREILQKRNRPYICVKVEIGDTEFAIPLRHHIRHKYAFFTVENRGLDYTKAIPLCEESFVASFSGTIEQEEYNALRGKEARISRGLSAYIKLYKKAKQYANSPYYMNILRYSSLQYFDV